MKEKICHEKKEREKKRDEITKKLQETTTQNNEKIINNLKRNYQIDRFLISTLIEKITLSEIGEIDIYYKLGK